MMRNYDDNGNILEPCGCIEAKVLDTGHYCSKVPLQFQIALGFATDCFDSEDLEPVPGNEGRLPDKPTLH